MRIFCAVRHSLDPRLYWSTLWSANFYPALRQMGHEIVESQTDLTPGSHFLHIGGDYTPEQLRTRGQVTSKLLDELKAAHRERPIDLMLSYFYNSHFDPAGFDEIHRMGIKTVNFYCNSMYQFELTSAIAPKVNYAWHAEKPARQRYLDVGANPVWVQMAADPDVYRPVPGLTRAPKSVFLGLRYADRAQWMAALIRADVPVDIYGPGWGNDPAPEPPATSGSAAGKPVQPPMSKAYAREVQRNFTQHGPIGGLKRTLVQWKMRNQQREMMPLFKPFAKGAVPFTRIGEIFSSYEVVLNFINVWSDGRTGSELIPHVRLRDFEAPMSRTCFITGYTDEITEFYEIGTEVDAYKSEAELVDKTKYYLSHPDAAERLRQAGYERALRDHTWVRRFEQLFSMIGM